METKNSEKEVFEEESKVEVNEASQEENGDSAKEENEEKEPEKEESIEDELAEAKDKYLRLYSEFENYRRRTAKEKRDLISSANKDLLGDILPVLDDFERALGSISDLDSFTEGVKLIQSKLDKVLTGKGLKKMELEKGSDFDEEFHEAITQIPAEEGLEGKIVDVVEAGYMLGEKVVRFAKVVVGAKQ